MEALEAEGAPERRPCALCSADCALDRGLGLEELEVLAGSDALG